MRLTRFRGDLCIGVAVRDSTFVEAMLFRRFSPGDTLTREVARPGGRTIVLRPDLAVDVEERTIVIVWEQNIERRGRLDLVARRSHDGGFTWSPEDEVLLTSVSSRSSLGLGAGPDGAFYAFARAVDRTLHLFRSDALSDSWETRATFQEETQVLGDCALAMTADGEIGVTYTAARTPHEPPLSIWFRHSPDLGVTWSDPVEISTQAEAGNQYDSQVAVGPDGVWHACWLRALPFGNDVDLYYARWDPQNGKGWEETTTRVNPDPMLVSPGVPRTALRTTDAEGHVYIAWPREFERFDTDGIFVSTTRERAFDPFEGVDLGVAMPVVNPVRAWSRIRFGSAGDGRATVRIYDARGRLVRRFQPRVVSRGLHDVEWDGRDVAGTRVPSGVYFWRVEVDGTAPSRAETRTVIVR